MKQRRLRLLALLVVLLVSLQPVAASVGLFVRSDPASVPSPEAGKTFCLNTADGKLYRYDGSSWIPQTLGKINATASSAPSISNDSTQGYSTGSVWLDTTNKKAYVCVDAATGAASWHEISNRIQASDIVAKFNTSDAMSDFVVSGLIGSDPGASRTMTTPAGVAYVSGLRIVSAGFSHTYPASKDTYDYLQSNGTVNHVEVPNNDPAPSGQPGLLLQKVVTDGSEITAVTGLASSYPTLNAASATAGQHAVPKSQADSLYSPIGIYASGPANRVVATPDGGAGVASQRALVNNDLPVVSIARGGTNNGSLGVTNLGIYHGNGSQIVQGPVPTGGLKKIRLNSAGDGFEWVDDTNGTVTNLSMTAPGLLFQSPVSVSNATSTPAIGLALRTGVAANRFIGDNGSGTWTERSITAGDLPTVPLNKGGLNNPGLTAGAFKILYGDDTKYIESPAAGANQSFRVNSSGTAFEAFTPVTSSGIPLGGNGTRNAPTTGTLDGVYFHNGNYATTGALTVKPGTRLYASGSITISHVATVDQVVNGGTGDPAGDSSGASNGGGPGGGSIPGYTQSGGGGGAFGGNGGNGGGFYAGAIGHGGKKYDWKNCFMSSGGAGALDSTGSSGGNGGNAGGTWYLESGSTITIDANITANATAGAAGSSTYGSGGGGGAGGGIAAVAATSITINSSRTVSANGGAGGNGGASGGRGGPGGGGIVYLNAPSVTVSGTIQALAGSAATAGSTTQPATAAEAGQTITVADGAVPLF